MKNIYANEGEMFLVQKDDKSGHLYLKVIVGGIAMYEVSKLMDAEMVDAFNENPKKLLKYVAEIRLAS
jgi:hypothetical protein